MATFFKADIARRGTNQTADVVLLHIFAHVDRNERIIVAEHEFSQRLGQQRFADTGRTGKDKAANRPLRILQARAAAADCLGNALDGGVLPDHPLVQRVFHLHQPLAVFGAHPRQGDTGHFRDDLGYHLFVDDPVGFAGFLPPLLGHLLLFLLQLVSLVSEACGLLEVLVGNRFFFLLVESLNLVVDLLEVRWFGHRLEPDPGTSLINHVDRLVRKAAAGDVAAGEFHRCLEGIVGDRDPMMAFVTVPQPLEDFDGLTLGGRFDHHQLKAAIKGRVFFDVLAVLIERGCPNALDFTTGQSRLEHV